MRKAFLLLCLVLLLLNTHVFAQSNTAHPRLWLTSDSVTQYRTWTTDANPLWSESLLPLAEQAKADMDAGNITNGDFGSNAYEDFPHENSAVLFAFMSQVHPDEARRADYAQRSRTLLMAVMNEAAKGPAAGEPFRDSEFSINDRSRWYGVGFPLTVDWIYPVLTAEDKATIRTVFLRWMSELQVAYTTTSNHPEPIGVVNDPVLVSDLDAVRWSGNNYYTAHARNMGMMALALDPADDPDGALQPYLQRAIGAWLYVNDTLMRTDAAGGFGTEGFEYSPQSVGYIAQLLLALHTAGYDDPAQYGQQASFTTNPFWDDSVVAYFNSLSPARVIKPDDGELVYQPAWYGSGQDYLNPDFIELFGALGVYDSYVGNTDRLNAIRWLQRETPTGGAESFVDRSNDASEFHKAILYFMLFDPNAPMATDPRPNYPTTWYASGMRRLLSRTNWTENATWLTYNLSWDRVDHQTGNGNAIEFYRSGEWLTKIRVGYDLDYLTSDNLNTLTVQNDPLDRDDYRLMIWERGSQWLYSANNPPQPSYSFSPDYLYIYGDATNLYNTDYEELRGVMHVSRSVLWLKPDVVAIYDRATTVSDNRAKRFFFNLPYNATVTGNRMDMTTPNGQIFTMTSLLPANAAITVSELQDEISSPPAHYETMKYRLQIASDGSADVRFLTVLQGADTQEATLPTSLITCDSTFDGTQVGDTAIFFARDASARVERGTFACVMNAASTIYLTNLMPNASYDVTVTADGAFSITSGTTHTADLVGVVRISMP